MKKGSPRILVFASGSAEGGGSGFEELVEFSRTEPAVLKAEIVGAVSNHARGGVYERAKRLGVKFIHWPGPFAAEDYRNLVEKLFRADYVMLSGWLKPVRGLDPARTINIHPGPLPEFGGPGMYGHHVHEAVVRAYQEGWLKQSAVTMHFVTEEYDRGPIILRLPVSIRENDTPETLAARVNEKERAWQAYVLNLVAHGLIYLREGRVRCMHSNPYRMLGIEEVK